MSVMRTKSIEQSIREGDEPEYQLKKRLSALDLTVFGVGVIIGAGIFTLTGRAAHEVAGPSIVLSFVLAALCCGLAALCYAEFASTRAGERVGLHVLVREPGRDRRVDHRLGPPARDAARLGRRGPGLVVVPRACSSGTSASRSPSRSATARAST